MIEALGIGALAASSLVIGAELRLWRPWPRALVGYVLAFGAGALISAVSFELALEGIEVGGAAMVGLGLAAGALTFYVLDGLVERDGEDNARGLALGALLDGIPEQLVLGIGIAGGGGVSIGLLAAVFVSNVPESVAATDDLCASGMSRRGVRKLWLGIAVLCTLATGIGWLAGDMMTGELNAVLNGFAAGAVLVMLTDSMFPDIEDHFPDRRSARSKAAGLATALGFAVAAALSQVS